MQHEENPQPQETASKKPLIADKDLFSRWLFAWLELVACGVLAMLDTVTSNVKVGYELIIENYSIGELLKNTAWSTTYTAIVIVFFASVALMAVPLFVERLKRTYVLVGMLAVQLVFVGTHLVTFYTLKPALETLTLYGFPWHYDWATLGYIYLAVSTFAVLELILTIFALHKRAKAAKKGVESHAEGS